MGKLPQYNTWKFTLIIIVYKQSIVEIGRWQFQCEWLYFTFIWFKSGSDKHEWFFCFPVGSVQFSSVAQSCPTLWDPMDCSMPGFPVHHQTLELLKLMSIELVVPTNCFVLCRPLLFLPSIFPSIRDFSNESVLCIRWPKDWSFSFNISPSNEYLGLISFKMDWLDIRAVQGTLKSLQHHS